MKRFHLLRGSEVLAEGVMWTKGGGMIMPAEGGLPWSFANAAERDGRLNDDVSLVWIDETHEAKREPPAFGPPVGMVGHFDLLELHDAMLAAVRKRATGKLPSERADEIATELATAARKRGEFRDWGRPDEDREAALWRVLDERLGRAP